MAEPVRKRVAILGGGAGAMAAAYELLKTPARRAALDVTIYQMGWRLGGKGASGRNADIAERIEEHGMHLWFGFYDNAFRVLGDAYEAIGRPAGAPLATLWDAFEACSEIVIYDRHDGRWAAEQFVAPVDDRRPGGEAGAAPMPGDAIHQAIQFAYRRWRGVSGGVLDLATKAADEIFDAVFAHAERRRDDGNLIDHELDALIVDGLKVARRLIWRHVKHRLDDDDTRHMFQLVDLITATITGINEERVFERGFSVIDDRDFRDWLRQHGASEVTIANDPNEGSGIVRGFYDLVFAYADGDVRQPDLAAGRALQAALKMVFDYKGSIMWRMRAGMGDTVFGPFYEALTQLGATVEFFHEVTALSVDPTGTEIRAIDLARQARPVNGTYRPMKDVNGLPCWPSQPFWDQLVDGERLHADGVAFETPGGRPTDENVRLEAGRDFDMVVLAIPAPAHAKICAELIAANPRFAEMVAAHSSVATQAFQVWSGREPTGLGWVHPPAAVASGFVEPLDTLCPMPQLLDRECWPEGMVNTIWYACGVLPDTALATGGAAEHKAIVHDAAVQWLETDASRPWPLAVVEDAFDWNVLTDRNERAAGPERFLSQYWRANTTPSDRYIRTPPGSVEKRLWPGESGFTNLALAGDWTHNFIDGGCVEAAVISGLLAARCVLEQVGPVDDSTVRIDGEQSWLLAN